VWFVWWLAGKAAAKETRRRRVQKGLLPLVGVIVLAGAFMGYYNWRLTGNPLLMPHTLNVRTYHTARIFLWQELKPKLHYNNMAFQVFYNGWERSVYQPDWVHAELVSREKVNRMEATYFWPGALLILPGLPFALLNRKMKLLGATVLVGLAGVFAVIWSNPHYAAPLTFVFYGLLVQGIRHLRTMQTSTLQFGLGLSRVAFLLLVLDTGTHLAYRVCDPLLWPCEGMPERAETVKKLEHLPGKHLVIVRYAELHNPHDEWVFNGADIDGGKIVWARDLGPEQNERLLVYFKDREVWTVFPDGSGGQIEPYRTASSSEARAKEATRKN
jgi:hypothetical protein